MSSSHKSSRAGRSSSDSNNQSTNPNSTPISTTISSNKRENIINLSNENKITFLNEDSNNNTNINDKLNFNSSSTNTALISSTISNLTTTASTTPTTTNLNQTQLKIISKSRFPRLQECAHFHYEISTVDIPKSFNAILCFDSSAVDYDQTSSSANNDQNYNFKQLIDDNDCTLFHVQVTSNDKKWILSRTYENFRYLDKHLHSCIFDRKFSCLNEINYLENRQFNKEQRKYYNNLFAQYLNRFCEIAFINPINCGPILNWFEIDNKGNRLYATDDSPINIPAVAAAVVKKRYVAQSLDELSLDVGNMISVIDMPPSEETMWWRGKKELEVGFFPSECVELIRNNETLPVNVADSLPKLSQSVRLKHGKLITLLRSFFNNRPARNHLQLKGIIKQRVFGCDLGEHLSNTGKDVPEILRVCTQFIEMHGMVDGIYRHTGLQSNIQKLRNAFDEEKFNEIDQEAYMNDVHSVSSLLKMYFRELPNPLLTYQLYHKFIKAINVEQKIIEIHDLVQQLPPPHYRTLVFLMRHLHDLAKKSSDTNMNTKNLAIVWAPNLLKSKEMDSSTEAQYDMLYSITLQANIAEFLISNADTIFDDKFSSLNRRFEGFAGISHRPISVCHTTGAKLLTLEEARDKYKQVGPVDIPQYHTVINLNDKNKKKDKDKKRNDSSKSKSKKKDNNSKINSNDLNKDAKNQDIMTSSIISTKSVNAPQLPILTQPNQVNTQSPTTPIQPPIPPTVIPIPPIQQQSQTAHLSGARSFMRNLRSGSTKSSQRDLNNESLTNTTTPIAPPTIPSSLPNEIIQNNQYASIRSSHSVQIVNNNNANESNNTNATNTSSFMPNRFRSSSTLLKSSTKNSPIPPPRIHTYETNNTISQQQFNKVDASAQINDSPEAAYSVVSINQENTKFSNNSNITGSPVMTTFKDHSNSEHKKDNLNRSNSNVNRTINVELNNNKPVSSFISTNAANENILNNNVNKLEKDDNVVVNNLDLDAVKRSNMQQFIDYITTNQSDFTDGYEDVNKNRHDSNDDDYNKFPTPPETLVPQATSIAPTSTTLITSSNSKIVLSSDIRLSASPLSSSTTSPSSSTSLTPSNELENILVINEDNYPAATNLIANDDTFENLNSYDNKIYLSTTHLNDELNLKNYLSTIENETQTRKSFGFDYKIDKTEDDDNNKRLSADNFNKIHLAVNDLARKNASSESIIIDYETGEKFSKNKAKLNEKDLLELNDNIQGLIINHVINEDVKKNDKTEQQVTAASESNVTKMNVNFDTLTQSVHAEANLHDHSQHDDECFYCKLNKRTSLINSFSRKSQDVKVDNEDNAVKPAEPVHIHDGTDTNCVYCRLKKQDTEKAHLREQQKKLDLEEIFYRNRSEDSDKKSKRPQSSNAVLYDDTNVFENKSGVDESLNRKSSPSSFPIQPESTTQTSQSENTTVEFRKSTKVTKSISSDEETIALKVKRRSTELNGVTSEPIAKPRMPFKSSSTPASTSRPFSTTIVDSSNKSQTNSMTNNTVSNTTNNNNNNNSNLQRSKSLATTSYNNFVFKNTDLNKVENEVVKQRKNSVRQSINAFQSNDQHQLIDNTAPIATTKITNQQKLNSNNSSKENIDDNDENESSKTKSNDTNNSTDAYSNNNSNPQAYLNKRKCSINSDELKRRRSEDEQLSKVESQNEQIQKAYRKNNYMSKSLQDNAQFNNNQNRNVLMQQKTNQNSDDSNNENSAINVRSKIKLMELKTNSQTSLPTPSITSPTSPTHGIFPLLTSTETNNEQIITSSSSVNIDLNEKQTTNYKISLNKQIGKNNNEINDNNISKLIKLKQNFMSASESTPVTTPTTSLPPVNLSSTSSSYNLNRNPLANNVFIIETTTTTTTTATKPNTNESSKKIVNSSIDDEYEAILSKRQTVKQLKSKFENK